MSRKDRADGTAIIELRVPATLKQELQRHARLQGGSFSAYLRAVLHQVVSTHAGVVPRYRDSGHLPAHPPVGIANPPGDLANPPGDPPGDFGTSREITAESRRNDHIPSVVSDLHTTTEIGTTTEPKVGSSTDRARGSRRRAPEPEPTGQLLLEGQTQRWTRGQLWAALEAAAGKASYGPRFAPPAHGDLTYPAQRKLDKQAERWPKLEQWENLGRWLATGGEDWRKRILGLKFLTNTSEFTDFMSRAQAWAEHEAAEKKRLAMSEADWEQQMRDPKVAAMVEDSRRLLAQGGPDEPF